MTMPRWGAPFKAGTAMTCQHGRFWRSCPRCRDEQRHAKLSKAIINRAPRERDTWDRPPREDK